MEPQEVMSDDDIIKFANWLARVKYREVLNFVSTDHRDVEDLVNNFIVYLLHARSIYTEGEATFKHFCTFYYKDALIDFIRSTYVVHIPDYIFKQTRELRSIDMPTVLYLYSGNSSDSLTDSDDYTNKLTKEYETYHDVKSLEETQFDIEVKKAIDKIYDNLYNEETKIAIKSKMQGKSSRAVGEKVGYTRAKVDRKWHEFIDNCKRELELI